MPGGQEHVEHQDACRALLDKDAEAHEGWLRAHEYSDVLEYMGRRARDELRDGVGCYEGLYQEASELIARIEAKEAARLSLRLRPRPQSASAASPAADNL